MLFVADATVFVAGGTVFAMDGAVLVVGETVFAMDGAVSLQNRRTTPCQPPPSLRFRCIWVKRLLQAVAALYTRAV